MFLILLTFKVTAKSKEFGQNHCFFNKGKPKRVWLQVTSAPYLWVPGIGTSSFQFCWNFMEKKQQTNQHVFILDAFPMWYPTVPFHPLNPSRCPPHPAQALAHDARLHSHMMDTLLIPLRLWPQLWALRCRNPPYSFRAKLFRWVKGKERWPLSKQKTQKNEKMLWTQ